MKRRLWTLIVSGAVLLGAGAGTQAALPVIDVASIAQLVNQIRLLESQLLTARNQLAQAQSAYQAITGGRGMELLLADVERNYLPAGWEDIVAIQNSTSAAYGALSASLNAQAAANAVLTGDAFGALPASVQMQVQQARLQAALLQTLSRAALATTSDRFDGLQALIGAIPGALDEKAALDLQARIGAEQTMVANDRSKLAVLFQTLQAEDVALQQQLRETAIRDMGSLRTVGAMGL